MTYQIVGIALQFFALVFVGYRLLMMHSQAEQAHRRDKNRQTIELMHKYLRDFQKERTWLADPKIASKVNAPSKLAPSDIAKLEQVLGFLERVAVGVKYDAYNSEIIKTTSRRYITLTYVTCLPYIIWRREIANSSTVFAELTWLVEMINDRKVDVMWPET